MNTDFARQQMIKQQVRAWAVLDPKVLQVFGTVLRENFVPRGYEALAFADAEIPLGHGEMMLTPTIAGRVLQTLALSGDENVLEVGTGSGFLTACLASLSARVTSIDIHDDLIATAKKNIAASNIENVELLCMDGMHELPEDSFDVIAITGSLPSLDPRFVMALRPGGRLFVVVGDAPAMAAKRVVRMDGEQWESETQFETCIAPLMNSAKAEPFLF